MYTLLINENNEVITSKYEKIMQLSSNVDNFQILTARYYNGLDLSEAVVLMKYILPSKEMHSVYLEASDLNYNGKDFIQYIIPANTLFTSQAGEIAVSFTFSVLLVSEEGEKKVPVRKTEEGFVKITPIAEWEGYIPDEMLNPLDQRIIALEVLQRNLAALQQRTFEDMVNDVRFDTGNRKIKLTNKNGDVGVGVDVDELTGIMAQEIVGADADGNPDGVTHLDDITLKGYVNLDKMIK